MATPLAPSENVTLEELAIATSWQSALASYLPNWPMTVMKNTLATNKKTE